MIKKKKYLDPFILKRLKNIVLLQNLNQRIQLKQDKNLNYMDHQVFPMLMKILGGAQFHVQHIHLKKMICYLKKF